MNYEIKNGNCVDLMRAMPDNSVDSIVTDPPYELGFMGKAWDASGIAYSVEMWAEALRVLKPGGHLLAFSGSRTYHRMACAVEDAGFEVRDQIMWVYGSGFPKSLDVSKAIDKAAGRERGTNPDLRNGPNTKQETKGAGKLEGYTNQGVKEIDQGPVTDAARQWEGWGTALKPAHEPICVARKPLIGTVAANVLAHGTGAINIDGCRVATSDKLCGGHSSAGQQMTGGWERPWMSDPDAVAANAERARQATIKAEAMGRWPANLIHDGSDDVVALFPEQAGAQAPVHKRNGDKFRNAFGAFAGNVDEGGSTFQGDSGSAARFFYCAKASKADRGAENSHPTVKPTALMAYLVRLVTPPGGLVLDPFTGSGSTGKAAVREGFRFIGCELSPEYAAIAEARIADELCGGLL